jgi:hypothetical protein
MNRGQSSSADSPALSSRMPAAENRAAFAQVMAAISRLELVVDGETDMLNSGHSLDLHDITARKSRGLYDLSRALKQFGQGPDAQLLEEPMRGLQASLQRNQAVLGNHLRAVGELAELMRRAVEMDEADGTYSMRPPRGAAS